MSKKLHISLIFSNLVVFKTLSPNHRMYNLYTKFVKILEICKQFSENLVNESGNVPRRGPVPKFSDLDLARQYSTHCVLRNLTAIMLRMVIIGRLTILLWAIASARSTSGSRLFAYMHLSIMPSLSPATKESTLRFQLPVWLLRTIIVTAILIPVHSPSV